MQKQVRLNHSDTGTIRVLLNSKTVLTYELKPGLNHVNLHEAPLDAGAYIYQVIINEVVVESNSLIIIS